VNITDEYGKPLQGVVVTYNDITKYTDNFGYAYFTAKSGKTHIEVSYKNVVKTAELDSINLKDDL
jgi:hypothetical protein